MDCDELLEEFGSLDRELIVRWDRPIGDGVRLSTLSPSMVKKIWQ